MIINKLTNRLLKILGKSLIILTSIVVALEKIVPSENLDDRFLSSVLGALFVIMMALCAKEL